MSGSRDDDDAANGLKPKPKADTVAHAATPQAGDDRAQQQSQSQQRNGTDAAHQVTKPGAATLVSGGGGIGGLVARPAYKQDLTYQSRESPRPVEPLHGPGETPQVAVTLPLDFERCNPQLIVNQLRSVIEPAQAAAIDAACAAKDLPRARQLLRDVLSSIAKRVNAAGDAVALAPLKQAGRAGHTWEAVKYYVAAAHFLRRLESGRMQGPARAPVGAASTVGTGTVGSVGTAHAPTSSGADAAPSAAPAPSMMHQPAPAPSMLAVAPTPRFDQLPMMMPPRSMLAVAQAPAPKAKPAGAPQVDPVRDAADDQRADDKLQAGVAQYTEIHRAEIARAVAAMMDDKRHGWPQPSARIDWQDQGKFSQALSNLIVAQVQAADIAALVAPYSLTTAYAQHVAPLKQAAKAAAPAFCGAVALLLQRVIFASVQRIGARVESLIADGVTPRGGGVVTSHPVDSSVATAMTLPGVLDAHRVKAMIGTATAKASVASVASLRSVTVHWLGRTDASLWNYLRTEPADASCEEVAVAIAGGKRSASEHAYQISVHGDRFQVAPTLARRAIAAHFAGEVVGPVRNDAFAAQPGAALAASPEGDEAALAQAAGLGTPQAAQSSPLGDKQPGNRTRDAQVITLQGVLNVQRDIGVQLHAIHSALTPLALASLIAPAEAFRARNVLALTAGDIHIWTQWLPVLNAQHLLLLDIAQRVVPAAQQALRLDIAARVTRQSPANAQALRALVKIYARAAGASHVPSSSQEILAELTAAQATAQLDQIDRSELDLQNAAADGAVRAQAGATNEAQAKLDAARTHTLQGDADSHEINEAQIAAREPALRRRMAAAEPALTKLLATVQAKRSILSTHEFYFLPIALEAAQVRLHRVEGVWLEHTRLNGKAGAALSGAEKWLARDAGVTAAERAFAQIGGDETLAALLRRGANLVDHQYKELAEDCAKLAVILMLTVVTAGIAAEVAGAAEIAMLARAQRVMAYAGEIAGLTPEATAMIASTVARGAGVVANLGVDTAINTGVQAVTQGGDVKRGAIDNLIMSGFNRLFAGPMAALQATEIEAAAMSRLGRAKLFVTGVTVEALAGMMQGELTRLTTAAMGMQNAHSGGFSDELLQQGAGIALGKHFHRMRQRWTQHEARIDAVYREEAEWLQLKAAREAFFSQADALALNLSPNPAAGALLLAKNVALSEQEMALKRKFDVRPGDIPADLSLPEHVAFAGANRRHAAIAADGYQGKKMGQTAWAQHLTEHGINVTTHAHVSRPEAHYVTEAAAAAPHDGAARAGSDAITRSPSAAPLTQAQCLGAVGELVKHGSLYAGARLAGDVLHVPVAQGREVTIRIVAPQVTAVGEVAAYRRHGETLDMWIATRTPDEQVHDAVARGLANVVAHARGTHADGAGESLSALDAALAHRATVGPDSMPQRAQGDGAKLKAAAVAESRKESSERLDVEVDLQLQRMGLVEPGPARDAQLAAMPAAMAAAVRSRLPALEAARFRPEAVMAADAVARPNAAVVAQAIASNVLPAAPATVRPYGAQDVIVVRELEVQFATLREIDARLALRDQPGTAGAGNVEIARGETLRRKQVMARTRDLMTQLQLGGDHGYITARLHELEGVFPGASRIVAPEVRARVARHAQADASHGQAEAARAARQAMSARQTALVTAGPVFTTKRVIVGDGMAALADVATLGVKPAADGWIDPHELLVIGQPDLQARMDAHELWGQRVDVIDRSSGDAHPAFSGADGKGDGTLRKRVEDPGEFMQVGELRDGMDVARQRLGLASVQGDGHVVESFAERRAGGAPWAVDATRFPLRVAVTINGKSHTIYAEYSDITSGPGAPRAPNDGIVRPADREAMQQRGAMYDAEVVMRGAGVDRGVARDVAGKRVFVYGMGPSGMWASVAAVKQGAQLVVVAGTAGNEPLPKHAPRRAAGEAPNPAEQYDAMAQLDRVQDALRTYDDIKVTTDRVVAIVPDGEGCKVTYLHGPTETGELYQVKYDVMITAMGYATTAPTGEGGVPTVKGMLGETKMQPQSGTQAPVLEDAATGRIRVIGIAAGDDVNVAVSKGNKLAVEAMKERRGMAMRKVSADSPNASVMEASGQSIRLANKSVSKEE